MVDSTAFTSGGRVKVMVTFVLSCWVQQSVQLMVEEITGEATVVLALWGEINSSNHNITNSESRSCLSAFVYSLGMRSKERFL